MPDHDPNDFRLSQGHQNLPRWAAYLLIAYDVMCLPLFLVCWLATLVALSMTLPIKSIWTWAAVLLVASIATLAAVTRAAALQANERGALGAYVARLATTTLLGRCLTDFLSHRPR